MPFFIIEWGAQTSEQMSVCEREFIRVYKPILVTDQPTEFQFDIFIIINNVNAVCCVYLTTPHSPTAIDLLQIGNKWNYRMPRRRWERKPISIMMSIRNRKNDLLLSKSIANCFISCRTLLQFNVKLCFRFIVAGKMSARIHAFLIYSLRWTCFQCAINSYECVWEYVRLFFHCWTHRDSRLLNDIKLQFLNEN